MTTMFIRVSMQVTRVFEVERTSYSETGETDEPKEDVLAAELDAVRVDPAEFLTGIIEHIDENSFVTIDGIEVQEVIPCQPTH